MVCYGGFAVTLILRLLFVLRRRLHVYARFVRLPAAYCTNDAAADETYTLSQANPRSRVPSHLPQTYFKSLNPLL